ncbi:MAG: hypothetical protein H6618_04285 [Deltaproteobacteria bacterium]|nr:hypothetical protein [Deltaproteobacteria bacterium]
MTSLIISLLMLAIAPAVYRLSLTFQKTWKYANRVLILLVTSLVVLHLLPESIRIIGIKASVLAFLGMFIPSSLERLWSSEASLIHRLTLLLAVSGLAVHGIMDGTALAMADGRSELLGWAVLLHRLPAAILIWSIFAPSGHKRLAVLILVILGLSTIVGYGIGQYLSHLPASFGGVHYFQALVAGSLLHIAFDQHKDTHTHHDHR